MGGGWVFLIACRVKRRHHYFPVLGCCGDWRLREAESQVTAGAGAAGTTSHRLAPIFQTLLPNNY